MHLSICLSIPLVCVSAYGSICLFVCPPVRQTACMSVCISLPGSVVSMTILVITLVVRKVKTCSGGAVGSDQSSLPHAAGLCLFNLLYVPHCPPPRPILRNSHT